MLDVFLVKFFYAVSCDIAGNEKVLAKCGEFEELEVQEFTNEADAFSD